MRTPYGRSVTRQRLDPALRRRRLQLRISTLKRRVALASVLGFGALLGLVTEHAVGSQRHASVTTGRPASPATAGATSFFDASGPSYSFGDGEGAPPPLVADPGSSSSSSQAPQSQAAAPPPVAQTSVS
jgi:hypothetical protein